MTYRTINPATGKLLKTYEDISDAALNEPRMRRLMEGLVSTYNALGGAPVSPTKVREELSRARDWEYDWHPMLYVLVDAAVARNPAIWNAPLVRTRGARYI